MDFSRAYSISEIANLTQSEILGSVEIELSGINEIHHVRKGDITFCDHPKYMQTALNSAASCIIVNQKLEAPEDKVLLLNENPFNAYNNLVRSLKKNPPLALQIHPFSEIHPTVIVETGAIIGERVCIGENSFIGANAVIYNDTQIGKNVRIGAQSVIGSDAFYFKREPTKSEKWQSCGGVIIADNVDIGALCTVNKGVSTNTFIGEYTKIDCHVHIGHDTVIGVRCLISAQVGISGNVVVEDDVIIYGQVGVAQNVRIGANAVVLGQTGVSKSIEGSKKYFGSPVQEVGTAYRELATLRQLAKK